MGIWNQTYLNSIVTSTMASLRDVGQVNELPKPWSAQACERMTVFIICQILVGR